MARRGVSPADFERYAEELAAFVSEAEEIVLAKVARRLGRGIEAPGWAEKKLAEVQELRREIQEVLRLIHKGDVEAAKAVLESYRDGSAKAVFDLKELGQHITSDMTKINMDTVTPLPPRCWTACGPLTCGCCGTLKACL
jgi:hypothetical protein